MSSLKDIYTLLFSQKKLDRDHGVGQLKLYLEKEANIGELPSIHKTLLEELESETWERKHGAFLGSKVVIESYKNSNISPEVEIFLQNCNLKALACLTDDEVRIRLVSGDVLGALCKVKGPDVYAACSEQVLHLIKENLDRDITDHDSVEEDVMYETSSTVKSTSDEEKNDQCVKQRTRRLSSDASQIFHDTAGWRYLETSMMCLQRMVEGCGMEFKPFITTPFLELLFKTFTHTNRFVRETGFHVLGSILDCSNRNEGEHYVFSASNFGHTISQQLGVGLSDNWSQVRLAASESSRKFLLSFETDEEREDFFPELLPKLCLNRYYLAEGVRIYSQKSWELIVNENGRILVKKYINNFVDHYISQTKANNHAVREASCACIAELASKIDHDATKPFVMQLLQTLLDCFCDDSWPVRDAACLACGNFVQSFPEESKTVLDRLMPLFYKNLQDGIPSVRQGAAGSLANVVQTYGVELFQNTIRPHIMEGLKGVKQQPSESEKYGQFDKGLSTFGVVKRLRDNDLDLHTDQQMYSCGSLAPKMGRGGGRSDHKFSKPSEPWEFADGCIHLTAELSQNQDLVMHVCNILPYLHEAVSHTHYTHHWCLLESLCKQLPYICKGIGKNKFKQYFEVFVDDIFYGLQSENVLTSTAASECLTALANIMSKDILRAKVGNHQKKYLALLDPIIA